MGSQNKLSSYSEKSDKVGSCIATPTVGEVGILMTLRLYHCIYVLHNMGSRDRKTIGIVGKHAGIICVWIGNNKGIKITITVSQH